MWVFVKKCEIILRAAIEVIGSNYSLFPLMCHWELKLNTFTFNFYCNCWIVYFLSCKGYVCITSITRLYVCAWSKLRFQEQGVCPLKYTFLYPTGGGGGGYFMFVVHSHLKQIIPKKQVSSKNRTRVSVRTFTECLWQKPGLKERHVISR